MKTLSTILLIVLLAQPAIAGNCGYSYPYFGRHPYSQPYCGYNPYSVPYYGYSPGYYNCNDNAGWAAFGGVMAGILLIGVIESLRRPAGHWELRQVWIPGTVNRYWVNQYYDKVKNEWVIGHWEETINTPGYWQQQQVWVP